MKYPDVRTGHLLKRIDWRTVMKTSSTRFMLDALWRVSLTSLLLVCSAGSSRLYWQAPGRNRDQGHYGHRRCFGQGSDSLRRGGGPGFEFRPGFRNASRTRRLGGLRRMHSCGSVGHGSRTPLKGAHQGACRDRHGTCSSCKTVGQPRGAFHRTSFGRMHNADSGRSIGKRAVHVKYR